MIKSLFLAFATSWTLFMQGSLAETIKFTATVVTASNGNSFPFGGNTAGWGPYYLAWYKNLPALEFEVGDVLAFDVFHVANAVPAFQSIAVGIPGVEVYTTIIGDSAALDGQKGDTTIGNYELRFAITNAYSFAGGELIFRFQAGGVTATANGYTTSGVVFNLVGSSADSGYFVKRYYSSSGGTSATGSVSTSGIPTFRLIQLVAPPSEVPTAMPTLSPTAAPTEALSCDKKFLRVTLTDTFGDGWQSVYWQLLDPHNGMTRDQATCMEDVVIDIMPCDHFPGSGNYFMTVQDFEASLPEGWWEIYWTVEVFEGDGNSTGVKYEGGYNTSFAFQFDYEGDEWSLTHAEGVPDHRCDEESRCSASKCEAGKGKGKRALAALAHGDHNTDSTSNTSVPQAFVYGERDTALTVDMRSEDCKGWGDLIPNGAHWYIADYSLTEVFDQGSMCELESARGKKGKKSMLCNSACGICLGDGSYVFRVTGPALENYAEEQEEVRRGKSGKRTRRPRRRNHDKFQEPAWEFCQSRGGYNDQLNFHISKGKCIPDALRWVEDVCDKEENSTVTVTGVLLLGGLPLSSSEVVATWQANAVLRALSNLVAGWSHAELTYTGATVLQSSTFPTPTSDVQFSFVASFIAEELGVDGTSYASVSTLVDEIAASITAACDTMELQHEMAASSLAMSASSTDAAALGSLQVELVSLTLNSVTYSTSRLDTSSSESVPASESSFTGFSVGYMLLMGCVGVIAVVGIAMSLRHRAYEKLQTFSDSEHICSDNSVSPLVMESSLQKSETGLQI